MANRGKRGKKQFGDNGFGEWGGYMAAKKAKLEEQFCETRKNETMSDTSKNKKGIFDGVAIFVNGYTEPTADDLKRIMMVHGGIFHHYQTSRTTHIIAKNLPDVKVKALKGNEIIVRPSWITDCLKAEKLLDYKPYLLFTNQRKNQPQIDFEKFPRSEDVKSGNTESPEIDIQKSPNKKTLDAKDENFLGEFYNNSRLHLISSMKAYFRNYVTKLRNENKSMVFPEREKLTLYQTSYAGNASGTNNEKIIMHIDMDCFFVSVSLRAFPDLRGKPVGVAHAKGNKTDGSESWSEIASCSYEARRSGVKNGMFVGPAKNMCPDLKIIPYDFEGYQSVAKTLYDTVSKYTLDIQAVSCDEMLVDLSSLSNSKGLLDVIKFGEQLRKEIYDATLCTASVGMGPNVLLAKIATKRAKPNGSYKINDDLDCEEFMKNIEVRDLPGVGRVIAEKLKLKHSVETCGQLQEISLQILKRDFGIKTGQSLYDLSRGRDDKSNIDYEEERKSVSAEINYGIRFSDISEVDKFIGQLSEEVCKRLLESSTNSTLTAKQITLKVMMRSIDAPVETRKFMGHGMCDSFSKSANMSCPTNEAHVIKRETMILLKMLLKSNDREIQDLRGIGIQLTKFGKDSNQMPSILNFINKSHKVPIIQTTENDAHKEKPDNKPSTISTLSLSQIDQDTLDELPSHIKEEIMQDVSSSSKFKLDQNISEEIIPGPSNPLASHSKSINHNNISFSQFDPNVLSELPIEIQKELRNQFSSKSNKLPSRFDKITTLQPNKQASNAQGRRKKGSPRSYKRSNKISHKIMPKNVEFKSNKCLFQINADKIAKNSLNTSTSKEENICEKDKSIEHTNLEFVNQIALPKKDIAENTKIITDGSQKRRSNSSIQSSNSSGVENTDSADISITSENPNTSLPEAKTALCSNNSIEELRPLLRKWTKSFVTPTYDDVETISNYFKSQISDNNIELVYLGLKSLCRNCLNCENPENWTGAYNGIVREVQRAMLHSYGKRLSVNFKF